MRKNGGRENGKRTEIPYDVGDFEALFAFYGRTHVFLIPYKELEARGFLRTTTTKGQLGLSCYLSDYQGKAKHAWTKDYCLDVTDPDLHGKVVRLLESCRSTSAT